MDEFEDAAFAILKRLEDWGVREDKMFTDTRERTLFKIISDAQTLLHARTKFENRNKGNWILEVFKPLPQDEADALREVLGEDDDTP